MYTIIGGDGREYGPVTVEQVQAWIAGGRANLTTKCKAAGSFEWKTIGDFPELTAAAAAAAHPGPAPLAVPMTAAPPPAPLGIVRCYERSWGLLKANFWPCVGVTLILWILSGTFFGLQWRFHARSLSLFNFFVNPLLWGGMNYFFLRKVRGEGAPGLEDFVAGLGKCYLQLLLIELVLWIFAIIGFICLVLPGIYILVIYQFSTLVAIDKGLGFWEAMEASRRLLKGNWWRIFGLNLLAIPFSLLGLACLGIGLLVTTPLIIGAAFYAYLDLSEAPPHV